MTRLHAFNHVKFLSLIISGVIVCAVPYIVTIFSDATSSSCIRGFSSAYVQGAARSPPDLPALQEKAESRVAALGYGVCYARSAILYALWGSIIVVLAHKS